MSEHAPPPGDSPRLAYEQRPQAVSVRGFRWLLVLTLVNTTLLGGFVLGPALSTFAKAQWANYQRRHAAQRAEVAKVAREQAAAAARQAAMVAEQKCLTHAWPMGTLVYDDDPTRPGGPAASWQARGGRKAPDNRSSGRHAAITLAHGRAVARGVRSGHRIAAVVV